MGTLFSTLDIARSGLQVAQAQIDVAAHNISNVNTKGYSRQRAEISARSPVLFPHGQIGRGVQVDTVRRMRDAFLDNVYRMQAPNLSSANTLAEYYARMEDLFLEPGEHGFGTRLNAFFDVLNDFANRVESIPARESVVAEAKSLAYSLSGLAERLHLLRSNANEHVRDLVPEINSIASNIAELNDTIRKAEAGGQPANDLRDERDRLLDSLADIVNISIKERLDGQVDVLVGDDVLVDGIHARTLEAVRNPALDAERNDLVDVRFQDNGTLLDVENGEMYAAMKMRDTAIPDLDARIDTLASALIQEVNRIQSQGMGLQRYTSAITSTNPVTDSSIPLSSAGLPFSFTPGSFDVVVYDAAGNSTTATINVTAATTLDSLAADLAAVGNFTASVVGGNRLQLGADTGFSFRFANDSAGILPALGVAGLFTGHDARTIDVNADIAARPALLSSGYTLDPADTGDNRAALALAGVRNGLYLDGGSASINDYYESTIARIGIDARANLQIQKVEEAFVQDFHARRQEVAGVSLDEEVTFLIQYQRAFEASARVLTVVDRMLETLIVATGG